MTSGGLCFSRDGRFLVGAAMDEIVVCSIATGEVVRRMEFSPYGTTDIGFVAGTYLGMMSVEMVGEAPEKQRGTVYFDLQTGKLGPRSQGLHRAAFGSPFVLSPHWKMLAVFLPDGALHLMDMLTWKDVPVAASLAQMKVQVVAVSDDGARLAGFAGVDGRNLFGSLLTANAPLKVWDVATGKELFSLTGIDFLAMSGDGKFVAGVDARGAWKDAVPVVVWDATTGKEKTRFRAAIPGMYQGTLHFDFGGFGHFTRWVTAGALSDDGAILATAYGGEVVVGTVADGKQTARWKASAGTCQLAMSADGKQVASLDVDGRVALWREGKPGPMAIMAAVGVEDYITLLPDSGFYWASKGALGKVAFALGTRALPFDQFDLTLDRPDKVLEAFGCIDERYVAAVRRACDKRRRQAGLSEDERAGAGSKLPEVEVDATAVPVSTPERRVKLGVKARAEDCLLAKLNVWMNGVPIYGRAGIDLRERKTHEHAQDLEVDLSAGRNEIQISALNEHGVESLRETVVVNCEAQAQPDLYVLAIGVAHYRDQKHNLTYSDKDARDVAAFFRDNAGTFAHVYVKTILDEEATREKIAAAKEFLAKAGVDDEVVVFFAGHGLLDKQLDYYFGTWDMDFADPARGGLSYEDMDALLDGLRARRKLMLIDTCHAGEVDKDDAAAPLVPLTGPGAQRRGDEAALGPGVVARATLAGVVPVGLSHSLELVSDLFVDVRRGTGAHVISAAGGAEYALESGEWGNGVFTSSVLSGLKAKAADADHDGVVTVSELRSFVAKMVETLTHGRQRPTSRQENLEADFAVY